MEDEIKLVAEEGDHEAVAIDMARSIRKMYEDRDEKVLGAKERLISQLDILAHKYRTANGVMTALSTMRDVRGENSNISIGTQIKQSKNLAWQMSKLVTELKDKANVTEPEDMGHLLDGLWDEDYCENDDHAALTIVFELMVLQLCQNVGPSADDIVEFLTRTDQEIQSARMRLMDFCNENDVNFDKITCED